MSTPTNTALVVIDTPGVTASIVLRGPAVPGNPPTQAEALILLERVLRHARGEGTESQGDPR